MATEATWVPQTPRTPKTTMPASHTRNASIGWRSNFPFPRRRDDSVAGYGADPITEDLESSARNGSKESMTGAWRNNFSFSKKRNDSAPDPNAEETEPKDSTGPTPRRSNFSFGKNRAASADALLEENQEGTTNTITTTKDAVVSSITSGVGSLSHNLRKKGSRPFKRTYTSIDLTAARARADSALPTPTFQPTGLQDNMYASEQPTVESKMLSNARKSRSFNDLKQQDGISTPFTTQSPTADNWENPRNVPGKTTPVQRSVNSSPSPSQRRAMGSPGSSPAPITRRPVPRSASAASPPTVSGNSWSQEGQLPTMMGPSKHAKNDSTLSVIVEHKPATPPKTPEQQVEVKMDDKAKAGAKAAEGRQEQGLEKEEEDMEDDSPVEQVDGVDFEMVTSSTTSHTLSTSPGSAQQEIELSSPSPIPSETFSPELMSLIQFPPPPIPATLSPAQKGQRWTVMSNARASSILLPDAFEQPSSPKASSVHRRASSENDTETMEIQYKDGVIVVPSRAPTPPPKGDDYTACNCTSRMSPEMERHGSNSSEYCAGNPSPPSCPKGTLPTPRSKFNQQPYQSKSRATSPQSRGPSESPKPALPSAGARIALAAANVKDEPSAFGRSMTMKTKPPARPPPPPPPAPNGLPSRGPSPSRANSTPGPIKRKPSAVVDLDIRAGGKGRLERTKSQVRRDLAKRMDLSNIGAVKLRDPLKSPGRPKRMESTLQPTVYRLESTASRNQAPTEPRDGKGGEAAGLREAKNPANWNKAQATEVEKIGSLNSELKRLEEQMLEARRHQKSLNEARSRLQANPNANEAAIRALTATPDESSSDESTALTASGPREVVLAQLDKKIEKWRKEMESAEHKRNRIRKKLAWHSADRLKLIAPPKSKTGPEAPLPRRPVSMFSPSSVYSEDKVGTKLQPMPSIDALAILNAIPPPPLKATKPASKNVVRQPKVEEETTSRSPTPALDPVSQSRPSIDASHPPTPKFEATPMTAANEPWLGFDNPYLTATANEPWIGLKNPFYEPAAVDTSSIKSPASFGASPGRQTIQLFAGEDIMNDLARVRQNSNDVTGKGFVFNPASPPPRVDRKMTIQVFAESGLASGLSDLVTALQEEIDGINRD